MLAIRVIVLTAIMAIAAFVAFRAPSTMLADGSDPMPLCRHGHDANGHACVLPPH